MNYSTIRKIIILNNLPILNEFEEFELFLRIVKKNKPEIVSFNIEKKGICYLIKNNKISYENKKSIHIFTEEKTLHNLKKQTNWLFDNYASLHGCIKNNYEEYYCWNGLVLF